MLITLPFDEAVAFATLETPLPPMVSALACEQSTITADIDLSRIESESRAMRIALTVGGTVKVAARLTGFDAGIATFAVTAHVRGLAAHTLLRYLVGPVDSAMTRAGLPSGLVSIHTGDDDPEVRIDVQRAVDERMPGVAVTALRLEHSVIHLEATPA